MLLYPLRSSACAGAAALIFLQSGVSFAFVSTTSSQLLRSSGSKPLHSPRVTGRYPRSRLSSSSSTARRTISLFGSRGDSNRDSYNWEEDVLDREVKDMLVKRAVDTIRYLWNETGGDIYGQWLHRFKARQKLGDDAIKTMGWARFLLKMMREEPVEVVVIRAAKKDSAQVIEARRKNNARPPTLSPWRHSVNQLSADWDAEEEEEMKVALDYPPQLKAVKKGVVVQPAELAKKLMDVREQLALEWREDLQNMETENKEILRLDSERRKAELAFAAARARGDDLSRWESAVSESEFELRRRLTYDHGEAFGGNSSPFRSDNYEALVAYATEMGALVVQERMRVDGDEMGWSWMEQFLYWAKTNSKYGSASPGDESVGAPPPLDGEGEGEGGGGGGGEEGRGAKGKRVNVSFGAVGVGMEGDDEDRKTR
ncbi:unnamed protein product [Scytosiphon promiscuus]